MDSYLAESLARHFEDYGLSFRESINFEEIPTFDTVPVTLTRRGDSAAYRVGFSDALTMSSLGWAKPHYRDHEHVLLLGARITEHSANLLRRLGINYLDQTGNAFITFKDVYIDVRGRRAIKSERTDLPRTRKGVNLFSAKRSQVIFTVLSWPELLDGPLRTIAATAGTSLGQAQETLELLFQNGFLDEQRQILQCHRDRLIDQWAATFSMGPGAASKTESFSGNWREIQSSSMPLYVSGEAAVPDLLRPETVVLYAPKFPMEIIRAHRWRKEETQPNIYLRHQFWSPPDTPAESGILEAPWLLIYADLLAADDSRQREAAELYRKQHDV